MGQAKRHKKSRWRTSGFSGTTWKQKLLLLGFFSSVLGLAGHVFSSLGSVSSGAGSGVGGGSSSGASSFASGVSSGGGGVGSSLGSVGGSSAGGSGLVSSDLGFGSSLVCVGGSVSSLFLLRAGSQGQTQGHRDQQLVDAHL